MYCSRCGKLILKPEGSCGTGYGLDENNNVICYPCCAEIDKEWMREHDKTVLYWDGEHVTNWPGSLVIVPTRVVTRKHNWRYSLGIQQEYVWFEFEGRQWMGRNVGDNQLLRCRKIKDEIRSWARWITTGLTETDMNRVVRNLRKYVLRRREKLFVVRRGEVWMVWLNSKVSYDRYQYIQGYTYGLLNEEV